MYDLSSAETFAATWRVTGRDQILYGVESSDTEPMVDQSVWCSCLEGSEAMCAAGHDRETCVAYTGQCM